jgi:transcriptional regulator ATRX
MHLTRDTQDAMKAENERRKRLDEMRKMEEDLNHSASKLTNKPNDVFLYIDKTTKQPQLRVDPKISRHLKPHQIEGIKFMWYNCYENLSMVKRGHSGSGCILAHCMGLGKTLQVIALVHTLIAHAKETKVNRVIIMLPVNVQSNWHDEVKKWTKYCDVQIIDKVFQLPMTASKGLNQDLTNMRLNTLKDWARDGGVLLLGYKLFVNLTNGPKMPKEKREQFQQLLVSPGADLIICTLHFFSILNIFLSYNAANFGFFS